MPQVLNITLEDVNSNEKCSKYTVVVVGCGQKGILYAITFAQKGFKVICTDEDASVIKKVAKGKTTFSLPEVETKLKQYINAGQISVSSDLRKAVSLSDIIVIAFTAKVDNQKKIDTSHTVNVCKQVGAAIHQEALVIYCGTAGLGFTDGTVRETIENSSGFKVGRDVGFAYNPIQITDSSIGDSELKVAANDKASLKAASTILKTITTKVKEISNIKTAELLTLFTVAKKYVNKALANELAALCENSNVDYFEILKMLSLDNKDFSASITDDENKNEVYLLLENAENLNTKLRLPTLARQINEDMVKHATNLTQEALRSCNKTLRRARVAVLCPACQESATDLFVRLLELKGAKVSVYNPAVKNEKTDICAVKNSLNEAVEGADCLVLLSWQEKLNSLNLKKLKPLMRSTPVIVDLLGKFDKQEVKTEGFIYCGFGRGTG